MLPVHKTCSLLLMVVIPLATIAVVTAFHPAAHLPESHSSASSRRLEATCCDKFSTHDDLIRSHSRPDRCSNRSTARPATPAPLSMSLSTGEPTSRSRAIGLGLGGWVAGLTLASRPIEALDPIRKAQEQLRIWSQEDADNVLGGGELASPEGGKTLQPVLALIPIVTLRLQLDEVQNDLENPQRFGDALAILQTQEFQKKDIKRVFNAYSDNIYYLPESERENKYLQGGATPSSRQTIQYLLRNDVIDNVEALTAEIAYLIREREAADAGGDGGGAAADLDETDLKLYLGKCQGGFDRYLGMVLQNEIDEATRYAKMALAAKKNGSAANITAAPGAKN